ncbi:MAG: 4-hydroxy-tetrahydrodipicolinate reductase [Syntrophobacteraceae bacterium]|nr:4-hydroxy-tetrahydrodipicolinate reductase [Syntrophobacteraceae bacterium]
MIRAAVAGIAGRMGSRVAQVLCESDGVELSGGFEFSGHPMVGKDLAEAIGGSPTGKKIGGRIEEALGSADVIIDFTNAASSLENLRAASARGAPMVIGSTGFTPEQMDLAKELASSVPVVISPNMSVGVNILFKLVAEAARLLGDDCDIEIVEAHHRFKKDAPSGTALKLARIVASSLDRDLDEVGVYARHGMIGERTGPEIGIQTIRGGDIVGEHTVIFASLGERIELVHKAHNRDNFARGAVRAARWVVGRPHGVYDMSDVLGIK